MKILLFFYLILTPIGTVTSQSTNNREQYHDAVGSLIREIDDLRMLSFRKIDSLIDRYVLLFTPFEYQEIKKGHQLIIDSLHLNPSNIPNFKKLYDKPIWKNKDEKFLLQNLDEGIHYSKIIYQLIGSGFIYKDSIHTIKSNGKGYDVLSVIDPQPNETIADIGAGKGHLLLILNKLNFPLKLYYNDINEKNKELSEKVYKNLKQRNTGNSIKFVTGKDNSTKLEKIKLDKILLVNTLHHFDKADEMMESIKKSMQTSSIIYLIENPKGQISDIDSEENDCPRSLPTRDITIALKGQNFKVHHEYPLFKGMYFWKIGI